jgi:hypothetical protein
VTYLDVETIPAGADAAATALLGRRSELSRQLDELRAHKADIAPAEYDAAIEKLLLEIAQISQQLRTKP